MIKAFLPWLIRAIPMGGYRTYIISILLVLVGAGMIAAAFVGILPFDIAGSVAATTILLGLQGFFGRAATAELEDQLSLALAVIVDTRDKVKAWPEVPLPDPIPEPHLPTEKPPGVAHPGFDDAGWR
ncbi:hypothetical protein [Thiothrix nivea]|uniref:Uncharacterized protein n=1 Tax=Thiothrix nivea (strain ATCC 35100 / DSM 5205 / JP2) TaxID=870187 RepID=A0A656H9Q0_THINJ|nr:hypothetical protein [Thiothrix nivea]EIJ33348.1 hypothetical protein Thini_0711 [Thiothrix nivea DSM 5205]